VISGYATPMQGETPYMRVGNWLVISLMLVLLGVSLLGWRSKFL